MAKVKVGDMEDYDLFDYHDVLCFKIRNVSINRIVAASLSKDRASLCVFEDNQEFEVIGNIREVLANAGQKILKQYK